MLATLTVKLASMVSGLYGPVIRTLPSSVFPRSNLSESPLISSGVRSEMSEVFRSLSGSKVPVAVTTSTAVLP